LSQTPGHSQIKELGAKPEDFSILADNAMKDACGLTNPHQPTKAEVVELFQKAYEQQ
jgi:alcohol dehydrogenase